jgi:hypothetical protein
MIAWLILNSSLISLDSPMTELREGRRVYCGFGRQVALSSVVLTIILALMLCLTPDLTPSNISSVVHKCSVGGDYGLSRIYGRRLVRESPR